MRPILTTDPEYLQAMKEAKAEYEAWIQDSKKERKMTKAKFRAQRLAKLHMQEMGMM
jgi:hypothetical protein